jgi:hypothetical protein
MGFGLQAMMTSLSAVVSVDIISSVWLKDFAQSPAASYPDCAAIGRTLRTLRIITHMRLSMSNTTYR